MLVNSGEDVQKRPYFFAAVIVAIGMTLVIPNGAFAQTTTPATSSKQVVAKSPNDGIEDIVRAYFADIPVMINIAKCESDFHQFDAKGKPLYGGYHNHMLGIYQILESLHDDSAAALGLDLTTIEGNLAFARHLYEESGTTPWLDSSPCWGSKVVAKAKPSTALDALVKAEKSSVYRTEKITLATYIDTR